MSFSIGQILGAGGEVLAIALEAEQTLVMDAALIKSGQSATTPGVPGSIEGVHGEFTVTFTPDAHTAAQAGEAAADHAESPHAPEA